MVKTGCDVFPNKSRFIQGFGTQFSIPQSHRDEKGDTVFDGYISVMANGEYPFEKGDKIKILKIKSMMLRKAKNGDIYYTAFCDIELIKETYRVRKGQRDISKVINDIPEELL